MSDPENDVRYLRLILPVTLPWNGKVASELRVPGDADAIQSRGARGVFVVTRASQTIEIAATNVDEGEFLAGGSWRRSPIRV